MGEILQYFSLSTRVHVCAFTMSYYKAYGMLSLSMQVIFNGLKIAVIKWGSLWDDNKTLRGSCMLITSLIMHYNHYNHIIICYTCRRKIKCYQLWELTSLNPSLHFPFNNLRLTPWHGHNPGLSDRGDSWRGFTHSQQIEHNNHIDPQTTHS